MYNRKVGDTIQVQASEFLGTPAVMGIIVEVDHNEPCYMVVTDEDDEAFPVTDHGHVLIGPPLNGKLVQA